MPPDFSGVGVWYEDFSQLTDDQVCHLLNQAWQVYAASEPQAT